MAKKPKAKPAPDAAEDAPKAKGSKKLLLASAALCLMSLGGGFFLARMAYMQDAETYAPDYVDGDADSDGHMAAKDDGHGDDQGKSKKPNLRTDITDPLAKDGHYAEQAKSLQAKPDKDYEGDGHGKEEEKAADSGLLDFGDILTNIESFDAQGNPTKAFLKMNLVVAYRPDEGSGKLMEERQPFMRDLFNGYLRGLSEADLRGMAGVLYVKAELLKRARAAVGSDLPQEVLINDLIVQ